MTYEEYAKIRDEKGYTDYKVAKETGISRTTLSAWKNGKYMPKGDKLSKIVNYLYGNESSNQYDLSKIFDGVGRKAIEEMNDAINPELLSEIKKMTPSNIDKLIEFAKLLNK